MVNPVFCNLVYMLLSLTIQGYPLKNASSTVHGEGIPCFSIRDGGVPMGDHSGGNKDGVPRTKLYKDLGLLQVKVAASGVVKIAKRHDAT